MSKKLSSKAVYLAQKNGKTPQDLIEEYGFANEQELEQAFLQIFSDEKHARTMLSNIKKNSKKKNSKKKKKSSAVQATSSNNNESLATIDNENEHVGHNSTTETPADEPSIEPTQKLVVLPTEIASCKTATNCALENLMKDEQELSAATVVMETEHKKFASMIQKCKDETTELAESVRELIQKLYEKKARLNAIKSDIATYSAAMQKLNGEISSAKSMLAEIRAQIAEQQKVVIWVYDNAEIEVNNMVISETLFIHEQLIKRVHELFDMPLAFETRLSIHEAYAVAKLECIVGYLSENNISYNIVHGNAAIQKFM